MDLNLLDPGKGKTESGTYLAVGKLKSIKTHIDKKGQEMAFGTLQVPGGEGTIDLLFFARTWENCKARAMEDEILAVKGTIEGQRENNFGKNSLIVTSIQDIDKLIRAADKKAIQTSEAKMPNREMHIRLASGAAENEETLNSLKDCIEENPGSCPVFIHVPVFAPEEESAADKNSRETIIRASGLIDAEASVSLGALERCPAVADVWCAG
jgi:DNA polymerase-3 subunit alpha